VFVPVRETGNRQGSGCQQGSPPPCAVARQPRRKRPTGPAFVFRNHALQRIAKIASQLQLIQALPAVDEVLFKFDAIQPMRAFSSDTAR
jgi:hypothetical protein